MAFSEGRRYDSTKSGEVLQVEEVHDLLHSAAIAASDWSGERLLTEQQDINHAVRFVKGI